MTNTTDDIMKQLEAEGTYDASDLASWVTNKCEEWRRHQEANYFEKWDEYYRIWRGVWAPEDRDRTSERSKLISPATQQAVESSAAELEEATFGRGSFFDVRDDMDDQEREDIEYLKRKLAKDFAKHKVRRDASEAILNAAIFGTGIAEIVVDNYTDYRPATQDGMGGRMVEEKACVKLRPIKVHNFRIPDTATCVEDALGVGIEEFVAQDYVFDMQEQGIYRETDLPVGTHHGDEDIEADPTIDTLPENRVKLLRYYGKVPRHMLEALEWYEENQNSGGDSYYVEALVVIANDGELLKAEPNPYLMNDRPIIAFQWDTVPGRFWGRGVCEKGYNPQKALDAELRQRRDAMAMNVAPMIGIDASRLPQLGQKLEVRPGKQILTTGDPREVLHPFRFGDLPQTSYVETEALSKMIQMATGAVDSAGIAGQVNGEATAAGISMSLGAIIKRHKRTLVNFQESFLIPFVQKAAWRYMQFAPDEYPIDDYKFEVTSSLGIMAREYQVGQLTQLLQTMPPESPLYASLVEAIIDNMNVPNREKLIAEFRQSMQPSPEQLQAQQQAQQMAERRAQELHEAQLAVLQSQAEESKARATKYRTEAQAIPTELYNDWIDALSELNNDSADDFKQALELSRENFERKARVAEIGLREKELNLKSQT